LQEKNDIGIIQDTQSCIGKVKHTVKGNYAKVTEHLANRQRKYSTDGVISYNRSETSSVRDRRHYKARHWIIPT
jgi:hypothetical protein